MRKATVQIQYDAEKLRAIRQYMGKEDTEFQAELEDFLQKLYEEHVPLPSGNTLKAGSPRNLKGLTVPHAPLHPRQRKTTT